MKQYVSKWGVVGVGILVLIMTGCGSKNIVSERVVGIEELSDLGEGEKAKIAEIRNQIKQQETENKGLEEIINKTVNYTAEEFLAKYPMANDPTIHDYRVGGYDVLDILVYEEPDLSRQGVRVSANGYISFPLIGKLKIGGLSVSQIERLISLKLMQGNFLLDAHVSVTVTGFNSKKFTILGSVNGAGSYPLKGKERVLDAISNSGGLDFETGGKEAMIIRTLNPDTKDEYKVVIRIDLPELLKGGNPLSNMLLKDRDLIYVPKAEVFYILGESNGTGAFPYQEKSITLLEAISMAGGFTEFAARNRTRIIRIKDGVQKVITVQVDRIIQSGKRGADVTLMSGDIIVVPERYF